MSYYDVTVVINGAVDANEVFYDADALDSFIESQERASADDGLPTEIYVLFHDHDLLSEDDDGECACAQYVTDGRPTYSWNVEQS